MMTMVESSVIPPHDRHNCLRRGLTPWNQQARENNATVFAMDPCFRAEHLGGMSSLQ